MQRVLIIKTSDRDLSSKAFEWDTTHAGGPDKDSRWYEFASVVKAQEAGWKLLAKPEYFPADRREPDYWEWWLVNE